jgi:hypothetical protein
MAGAPADRPVGSVVVPAHDEERVITRCLDHLASGFAPGELEIVVACNGCSDATADLARAHPAGPRVLETDQASKPVALRMADAATDVFPRLYLDADVVLSAASARTLLETLATGPRPAGRPPLRYDTSRSSWPVRAYYRARLRAPSVLASLWGAGVYGLSRRGRERFDEFPDVVAEDLFVDRLFGRDEIAIVDAEPVVVMVPRTAGALLKVLRRAYRGSKEPSPTRAPGAVTGQPSSDLDGTTPSRVLREVVGSARTSPAAAVDAAVYIGFAVLARILVRLGRTPRWERDDSSREG